MSKLREDINSLIEVRKRSRSSRPTMPLDTLGMTPRTSKDIPTIPKDVTKRKGYKPDLRFVGDNKKKRRPRTDTKVLDL